MVIACPLALVAPRTHLHATVAEDLTYLFVPGVEDVRVRLEFLVTVAAKDKNLLIAHWCQYCPLSSRKSTFTVQFKELPFEAFSSSTLPSESFGVQPLDVREQAAPITLQASKSVNVVLQLAAAGIGSFPV